MIEIPIDALLEIIVYGGLLLTAITYWIILTFAAINN
jgi:hypothetical protein